MPGAPSSNAFIARSRDELVGFGIGIDLKDLGDLTPAEVLDFRIAVGLGIGKVEEVGVDLFHGIFSYGVNNPELRRSYFHAPLTRSRRNVYPKLGSPPSLKKGKCLT